MSVVQFSYITLHAP